MTSYTLRLYTSDNWAHIAPLVDAWPFKQLGGHSDWQLAGIKKLASERMQSALGNEQGGAWVALQGNAVRGLTVFSKLLWDSEQLRTPAARLDHLIATGSYREQRVIKQTLLDKVLDEARKRHIRHLSARVDASDCSGLHVLEETGFITVDTIITFAKELSTHQPVPLTYGFRIRLATSGDAERAADIARHAYRFDRYHTDPSITTQRADELHAVWLRNSCTGTAADAVFLAEDEQGLLGYVTCKLQRDTGKHLGRMVGTIVLVATAERGRGLGVGMATTMVALEWFREQGTAVVEVGTQLRNIPAARLYQKCGFAVVGSFVSLRKLF